MKKKTHEQYVQELKDKNIPYVPKEPYTLALNAIDHECEAGHIWKVTPANVLFGRQCPKCKGTRRSRTHEEYLQELTDINATLVPLEKYDGQRVKIKHKCLKCENIWETRPEQTLRGQACPNCAEYGFNRGIPASLYYVKLATKTGEIYYKIGVTNKTALERLEKENHLEITILREIRYNTGKEAEDKEKDIIAKYKEFNVKNIKLLKNGGNTELYDYDILNLDTENLQCQ